MAKDSLSKASTPEPVGPKPLWHKKGPQWHLPYYIQHIANDLISAGHGESQAIAIAIGTVKRWARGGGKVDSNTRAAASKALAEWEKLKSEAHGSHKLSRGDSMESPLEKVVRLASQPSITELVLALAKTAPPKPGSKGKKPYGNVEYADPKNGKYPIDPEHVEAAWSYINMPKNAAKYPLNGVTLESVKARIKAAMKKHGHETPADVAEDKKDKGADESKEKS